MASVEDTVSVDKYTRRFESYLDDTEAARTNSENCRDYYNHKQWTAEEINKLKLRKQAAIVVNRIQPKIDALKGLLVNQRTDPKAFPRTKKHEQASYAITDGLRYVNDNTDFDGVEEACAEDFFVEGTCACITELKGKNKDVLSVRIPWDRYYYDPHSRELDFSDAKWQGIVIWMDMDDAVEMFPEHSEHLTQMVNTTAISSDTYDDKPIWIDKHRKRVRVCQEFSLEKGVWKEIFYTYQLLLSHKDSPYEDEDGEPSNPIEAQSAYIDRDLKRFGPCHFWLDLQDEVNHRRSKALHLLSQRQTAGRKGAVDIQKAKNELAKADGHVEYLGDRGDFEVLPTNDMAQAQFSLLAEAKQELDAISLNAQLSGERQGDLSGKAVQALQAGGMLELAPAMAGLQRWRRRVFRQWWWKIKQFWREERWIRVTDDYNTLHWVGLNHKMSVSDILQEQINDESLDPEQRQQAALVFQQMMQTQDPRLSRYVEMRNDVSELDVDIVLDVSPDTLTVQNEQFQILAQLAASRPEVPFSALLKLSQIREKDAILEDLEQQVQQNAELQQAQAQLGAAKTQADIQNTEADSAKKQAEAIQTELENQLLLRTPVQVTNVSV